MIVEEKNWPKRQLQIESKEISDRLLFNGRLRKEVVYIYPLKFTDWVALLFTRYHAEAVALIKDLPEMDRFFYQNKVNRFKQISIWCVRNEQSEKLLQQLKALPDLQVELLVEEEGNADH
ncbi:MAG: hypothetical protein AAGF83_05000 [Cyanobacteria bacterium P01_G01_bin.67]